MASLASVASGFVGMTRPQIVNRTGYSPNSGDWCAWFVWCCLDQVGYAYSSSSVADRWGSWCFKQAVANGTLPGRNYSYGSVSIQAGDIITFRTSVASYGSHVAIMAGPDTVINGNWWTGGASSYDTSIVASRSVDRTISGLLDEPGETMAEITITRLDNSGGGGNPDEPPVDPPSPGQKGHWEWVEETITVVTSGGYDYTGTIYECGANDIWSGQSGTQDVPQAPTKISSSSSRINQRWEPFMMYTDERTLTYTSDGQPVWSNWETKYTGQDNFPLGSQPTYGNGWEMEWRGDDD